MFPKANGMQSIRQSLVVFTQQSAFPPTSSSFVHKLSVKCQWQVNPLRENGRNTSWNDGFGRYSKIVRLPHSALHEICSLVKIFMNYYYT
jgi:hypothetical protein